MSRRHRVTLGQVSSRTSVSRPPPVVSAPCQSLPGPHSSACSCHVQGWGDGDLGLPARWGARGQGAAEAPRERRLAGQGGEAGAGAAQPPTCGPGEPSAPAAAPCRQSLRETVRCPGCPSPRTAATAPSLTPTRSSAGGYAGTVVPTWAASARGHVRGSAFLRLRPRHSCESLRDRRPALGDTGSEAGGCKGCRRATQGCH